MYYVYSLSDPRDKQIFYIGMGKNDRAYSHLKTTPYKLKSNPHRFRKIKQIQTIGHQPIVNIVASGFANKEEAGKYEKLLIEKYGRRCNGTGILTNIKPGGIGGQHIHGKDYSSNKPVDQYDKLGNYIQTFPSAAEAARTVGCMYPSAISQCCHNYGNAKTHRGFFWTYANEPLNIEWCMNKIKPIYQWNLRGEFIAVYHSSSEASRVTGIARSLIGENVNGNISRAGDYMWTYDNTAPSYTGKRRTVLCIETGQIFKSVGLAAIYFNADRSSLAAACRKNGGFCKGYTFTYLH